MPATAARAARYSDSTSLPINAGNTVYARPVFGSQKDENPIRVRALSDVAYHVAWGRPATTSDAFVPANTAEFYDVGQNDNLYFTRASADGDVWLTVVDLS